MPCDATNHQPNMGVCTVWTIYFGISLENYIPNQQNDRFCAQSLEQQINKSFENHVLNESSNVGDIAELWTNPETRCSAWNGWQIDLVFVAVSAHVACISLIIYMIYCGHFLETTIWKLFVCIDNLPYQTWSRGIMGQNVWYSNRTLIQHAMKRLNVLFSKKQGFPGVSTCYACLRRVIPKVSIHGLQLGVAHSTSFEQKRGFN